MSISDDVKKLEKKVYNLEVLCREMIASLQHNHQKGAISAGDNAEDNELFARIFAGWANRLKTIITESP